MLRHVINGEVGNSAAKGDEVPGHQASVRDHLPYCRWLGFGLMNEFFASTAYSNGKSNHVWHPLPSLPDVDDSVSEQGGHKAYGTSYTNPHIYTDLSLGIDSGNCLTANDGADETEASKCSGVQEYRNRHEIQPFISSVSLKSGFRATAIPKGVSSLDHLAHPCLVSPNAHEGWWNTC